MRGRCCEAANINYCYGYVCKRRPPSRPNYGQNSRQPNQQISIDLDKHRQLILDDSEAKPGIVELGFNGFECSVVSWQAKEPDEER